MPEKSKEKIIIGIDPGTVVMGYGILSVQGRKASVVALGVLMLSKYENQYVRLQKIYEGVLSLIDRYRPDELSIEAPFYGQNVQSMLKLGRAQGVAIAACMSKSIPVHEYAPLQIKRAITGNGSASKEQVAKLLQSMLNISDEQMLPQLDATDGLAAAYCHFLKLSNPLTVTKGSSDWKSYIKNNPDKVRGV